MHLRISSSLLCNNFLASMNIFRDSSYNFFKSEACCSYKSCSYKKRVYMTSYLSKDSLLRSLLTQNGSFGYVSFKSFGYLPPPPLPPQCQNPRGWEQFFRQNQILINCGREKFIYKKCRHIKRRNFKSDHPMLGLQLAHQVSHRVSFYMWFRVISSP